MEDVHIDVGGDGVVQIEDFQLFFKPQFNEEQNLEHDYFRSNLQITVLPFEFRGQDEQTGVNYDVVLLLYRTNRNSPSMLLVDGWDDFVQDRHLSNFHVVRLSWTEDKVMLMLVTPLFNFPKKKKTTVSWSNPDKVNDEKKPLKKRMRLRKPNSGWTVQRVPELYGRHGKCTASANVPSEITVKNVMRTFAVLSHFETARVEIIHCTDLELTPGAIDVAVQTVSHLSVSSELQDALIKTGLLWFLLPLLLRYDSTAEESDLTETHGVGASFQIARNLHAARASEALSRLCGLYTDGIPAPYNKSAVVALQALLTPKLMLKKQTPKELLRVLPKVNSNLESPKIIWKSTTHSELLKLVEEQCTPQGPDGTYDLKDSNDTSLSKELCVGKERLLPIFECFSVTDASHTDISQLCSNVLSLLTAYAPCLEAMVADGSSLLLLLQMLHPFLSWREGALQVLSALAGTSELAWAAANHEEIPLSQRAAAASLLGRLVGQPMHGPRVDQTTEIPELVWTPAIAASLSAQVATVASDLYRERMKGPVIDWDVPEQTSSQQEMRDEPQVGGIYVRLFLKDPKFPLRNPKRVLGLLDQYVSAVTATHYDTQASDHEVPLLLSTALVSLLRVLSSLADHVGYLGYVPKLVAAMAYEGMRETMALREERSGNYEADVSNDAEDASSQSNKQTTRELVRLSCLRVLHQLAASTTCAEAVTSVESPQVVPLLMKAIGWQGGSILALEPLKRAVAA